MNGLDGILSPSSSSFLQDVHHDFAQTDGTYAWPNSRDGDMLKKAKKEIESLMAETKLADAMYKVTVSERNLAQSKLEHVKELIEEHRAVLNPELRARLLLALV